jgi:hypothetical protein
MLAPAAAVQPLAEHACVLAQPRTMSLLSVLGCRTVYGTHACSWWSSPCVRQLLCTDHAYLHAQPWTSPRPYVCAAAQGSNAGLACAAEARAPGSSCCIPSISAHTASHHVTAVLSCRLIPQEQVQHNPFTLMAATRRGGHLAFLQVRSSTLCCRRLAARYCISAGQGKIVSSRGSARRHACSL